MGAYNTKYGMILGAISEELYEDGSLKECMIDEYNQLKTEYGHLIPKYGEATIRAKYGKSVSFYPSGNFKSIYLEQQTEVMTSIGLIPAELITFYEDGNIHRIFPLNGKLSGYWGEEEEYELAAELTLPVKENQIVAKVISIQFNKNQGIKSVTLWRQQEVKFSTIYGDIVTNIGFSLYETGELQSIEPKKAVNILTPIGSIKAHDINAIGIHADKNSLSFYKDGNIKELITSTSQIEVTDKNGLKMTFAPKLVLSYVSESQYEIEPLTVSFQDGFVSIKSKHSEEETFYISECSFHITNAKFNIPKEAMSCSDCENCKAC